MNNILVIDGHDGSGKTTLSKKLAQRLDGIYIRPYGAPFGAKLMCAAQNKDYGMVLDIGKQALEQSLQPFKNSDCRAFIFDRLWITLFTLIPKEFHARWDARYHTIICWANLDTTIYRINSRNEQKYSEDWHRRYLSLYKPLAHEHQCALLNTSELNEVDALDKLALWANSKL
jgi:deoxyadenosine/deoxycytidine kinase